MKKRTVKIGRHDFRPNDFPKIWRKPRGFMLDFSIPESSWYDTSSDGLLGRDGKDINKLGGFSFFSLFQPATWPKNRLSVLVGERPHEEKGKFEIFAYVNDAQGGHKRYILGTLKAGQRQRVTVVRTAWDKYLFTYSAGTSFEVEVEYRTLAISVGAWQGGNRPAPIPRTFFTELRKL